MPSMPSSLSLFPFLTPPTFASICKSFLARVHAVGGPVRLGWLYAVIENAQDEENLMLVISKKVEDIHDQADCGDVDIDVDASINGDDDEEAILRGPQKPSVQVTYSILLHKTYRVPVLYLESNSPLLPVDRLVSPEFLPAIKEVGVLGALSPSINPISQRPASMVHPCSTPEALLAVAGGQPVTTDTYLFLWLGLVGNAVGLSVPKELVLSS